MNEPWLSSEICKIMPMLIVGIPILALGVVSGLLGGSENFKQYITITLAVALMTSVGSLIFALVAKFLGQPSSVFSSFLMAGGMGTVMVIAAWYTLSEFDL